MKQMLFRTGIAQIWLLSIHLCSEGFKADCPLSERLGNGGAAFEAACGAPYAVEQGGGKAVHALWFLQEQHCSRLLASLLTAQSCPQPSTGEGSWMLESTQKAQQERGLVRTGANAVVV